MFSRWRRPLLICGASLFGLLLIAVAVVFLFYGSIGEWAVREKALPRIEGKLGRRVVVDAVHVERGKAVLSGVRLLGRKPEQPPLVEVAQVSVEFDFVASLFGRVELGDIEIRGASGKLVRAAGGDTNFGDIVERLRRKRKSSGAVGGKGRRSGLDLARVRIVDSRLHVEDEARGLTLVAHDVSLGVHNGTDVIIDTGEAAALTRWGSNLTFGKTHVRFDMARPLESARVRVADGRVKLWKGLTLTGIAGTVAVQEDDASRLVVNLAGGYGDLGEELWYARGWFDPRQQVGNLELAADQFTFDKLDPVLSGSEMVLDYDKTSLDASFRITVEREEARLTGQFGVSGLNLFHPLVAAFPVRGISASGRVKLFYDRMGKHATWDTSLESGGVEYLSSGELFLPGGSDVFEGLPFVRVRPRLTARLAVPAVPCQEVLDSIPPDFVRELAGFELAGTFAADVRLHVDWADLEKTALEGGVGIFGCKVVASPHHLSAKRLKESFEHQVLVGEGEYETIRIGPESEDFVPLEDVSPYLVRSFLTTEDSSFFKHKGFITREFRTALVRDLEAGRFKYGASSITMQMVKNVFLKREKTLTRKFQELFLTWYVETQLDKERIMEIYVNAIEYGPGLYGIKPAAEVYFGKHPRNLTPVEAAFFSSILPAPSRRYKQFCKGQLSRWSEGKILRVLGLMHKRSRLTDEEFLLAQMTPLVFAEDKEKLCKKGGYAKYKKRNRWKRRKVLPPVP